ncbi:MAG: serine hydrolase domain-containing protein [Mycobacteriales bacterium]
MGKNVDIEVEPAEVGFDAARLRRIDKHFARYVDDGRLVGWQIVLSRHGKRVHSSTYGMRDREAALPVEQDTVWRIYSMTKPITTVIAMQLFEEGAFALTDELSRYLPAFADLRIYRSGTAEKPTTVPATEPIRIWHLMTHTAGLTYGFMKDNAVDEMYRLAGSDFAQPAGLDLAGLCDLWAGMPLMFEPGASWNYSVATDVLGRLIEVLTGKPLDVVFRERVLDPLGMDDTDWWAKDASRLAALYAPMPGTGEAFRYDTIGKGALHEPSWFGGGGGLVSTAHDYDRFTGMLLGRGELEGTRLLGSRTLDYMARNHLPDGALLTSLARGQFAETAYDGMGFGLGFGVLVDPVAYKVPASVGEFTWGGAASTAFWVDPAEQITAAFYAQLLPSSTYPIRTELRSLVYTSLID